MPDYAAMAKKVFNGEKCKHGMRFEYCAQCQRVETLEDVKFPVQRKNADGSLMFKNGKPVFMWLRTQAKRVNYRRYR